MGWRATPHNAACRNALLLHDGQALAALQAPRAEDVASPGRRHAVQEAVPAPSRDDLRLIRALGHCPSFDNNIALPRAQRSIGGAPQAYKRLPAQEPGVVLTPTPQPATSTALPATSTAQPTGGRAGAIVGPNTGSGPGGGSGDARAPWIVLGIALLFAGLFATAAGRSVRT